MFAENLSVFFADFGLSAELGEFSATVLLDCPQSEIFDGMQQTTDYTITYRSNDFHELKAGDIVIINGTPYKVRQTTTHDDGIISTASMQR